MPLAALTKAVAVLWKALSKFLRVLGRWLVRRLQTKGIPKVLAFMELRVETFEGRLQRARSARRKRWLKGRIQRWNAAREWIEAQAPKLAQKVVDQLAERAEAEEIEWDAAGESYDRWHRATRQAA